MNHDARPRASAAREIVILGVTTAGRRFRPSDWAERLCGMMSVFGEDRHLSYSPYLKPIVADGANSVVIDGRLEAIDPLAFRFLMDFARDNELATRPGRDPQAGDDTVRGMERRQPEPQPESSS